MDKPRLLVVGSGSVGKRHIENFINLGCLITAVDPREDRIEEVRTLGKKMACSISAFNSLDLALNEQKDVSGIVICSPPKYHVEQADAALTRGIPVFMEKPFSPDLDSVVRLEQKYAQSNVPILLGYTYRWWPSLRELKQRLSQNPLGKIRHVHFNMSAHLADWHPWESYQDFFMASKELGGGALLDESHFIDLMIWFFGMPKWVWGKVEKLSSLKIETDDNVDAWFEYNNNLRATLHLDLYGRPHKKDITIVGETGTLYWTFSPDKIRFSSSISEDWQESSFYNDRNDMFLAAAREFKAIIQEDRKPSCTIEDGRKVLAIIEAIRTSSKKNKAIKLSNV